MTVPESRVIDIQELGGSRVGPYQLVRCLGHGTHTAVYQATGSLGSQWALKVIDHQLEPDPALFERLQRDAELCSRVDHPAILPMYDVGRDEQVTFATAPFLEAPTLDELMTGGRIDADLMWSIVTQVADALHRAHDLGLVCRGLKPNNILIDSSGRAYLAEFGVVSGRTGPAALASPGYRLRSPQYLAPEQVRGEEPGLRSDVYAVAVLVFELLTESPLFASPSASDVLTATLSSPAPSAHARNRRLPPGVDRIFARGLSKSPAERHESVWALLDDLVAAPDTDPGGPGPAPAAIALPESPGPIASAAPRPELDGAPAPDAEETEAAAIPAAPIAADSAVSMLHKMGVPRLESHDLPLLNSYFACLMRHARDVAGGRWQEVLEAAGLERYLVESPPDDGERAAPAPACSALADAFEAVFEADAVGHLRTLGRTVTDDWLRTTHPKPFRVTGKPESKVASTLAAFNQSMDRVRGEALHASKQIDKRQFWIIHYANLLALGRMKAAKSCHFWCAAFESALRWGGLDNDWAVEETECGCVTGTFCCVFTVERIGGG